MELTLDRLTKQFGARIAVDRVSATLTPGVTGLLGANGAGKTTLMRMVCDVLRPTGGQILLDGRDAQELGDEYRALLGYLPQDFGYYPDFTALDFMRYMATLKGFSSRDGRARSMDLLEEVGLADDARRKVKTFSGGMRQRLGIAQAMINDPAILVLDEPTAGLDPKERVRFRNLIAGFAQDKVVILSTHIVSDVEFIANRILVMRQGSFVLDGTPEQVVAQATGKVWECHVEAHRAEEMAAQMQVANVRYAADGHAVVRVVADEPPMAGASAVEPTLEDLYLLVFRDGDGR
ncbi:MAG: ABC transporter ATP-binding protein [Atopobiaceae bacterium]|jgi:ABC-2 type transport system ATP-binding protein|nr:ABC transporter ATP-binding protein [Atopobiaceae bacterium]MCH4120236.1 ABC transporter ATP-binding protein [Atopobiaceae bacterium]MCI1317837.1 ABC transporter ATP-binding protein [Atopobiaceae bacterium]MCI1389720.1 ABC transporter ATP-binding protein [Atopobiaceae bacterium]MCI1431878.1 ABC transporter ATP-binding protein [Atopobiaceae bacterium]